MCAIFPAHFSPGGPHVRINSTDSPSRNVRTVSQTDAGAKRSVSQPSQPDSPLSAALARHFTEMVEDGISPQFRAILTELEALGMSSDKITIAKVMRAMVLKRFSIPLSGELLSDAAESDYALFKGLTDIHDAACSLLGDLRLTGTDRTAVSMLVSGIESLFENIPTPEFLRATIETIIDLWAADIERRLFVLAEHPDGSGRAAFEPEIALEALLKPLDGGKLDSGFRLLVETLREGVADLRAALRVDDSGGVAVAAVVSAAVRRLNRQLSDVVTSNAALFLSGEGGESVSGMIMDLIRERLGMLEHRLLTYGGSEFTGGDGVADSAGMLRFLPYALSRSGMSYEWRLLSWYRAGRIPANLFALVKSDLKGILMEFLGHKRNRRSPAGMRGKLDSLTEESGRLMNHITRAQLGNIVDNQRGLRTIYIELPLGGRPGEGYGKIRVSGEPREGSPVFDPGRMSIEILVETSNIGTVGALMTVWGKTVSVRCEFSDEQVSAQAQEMRDELKNGLLGRGFAVGTIDMAVRMEPDRKPGTETGKHLPGLDLRG